MWTTSRSSVAFCVARLYEQIKTETRFFALCVIHVDWDWWDTWSFLFFCHRFSALILFFFYCLCKGAWWWWWCFHLHTGNTANCTAHNNTHKKSHTVLNLPFYTLLIRIRTLTLFVPTFKKNKNRVCVSSHFISKQSESWHIHTHIIKRRQSACVHCVFFILILSVIYSS